MFTEQDRDRVYEEGASHGPGRDPRVVAAAVVGSLAIRGPAIVGPICDLTFGVSDEASIPEVLNTWSERLAQTFDAAALFDLPSGGAIYRVFLLRGCLQVDLCSPRPRSSERSVPTFGCCLEARCRSPTAGRRRRPTSSATPCTTRFERESASSAAGWWQAEYWISSLRDNAMSLARRRRGLAVYYGRGFDNLPAEIRSHAEGALVRALEPETLEKALQCGVELLLTESDEAGDLPSNVEARLRAFTKRQAPL